MPYTLLRGQFVIRYPDLPRQGPEPDGDTIKFRPDTPALVETLPRRSGTPPDINARGISARLEAIDALETHFQETHQELAGANAARDELLRLLGFTNVRFFDDLPNKVQSADQDALRGHVLSNGIDANGRLIAFVYPGDHPGPDGTTVFVDPALVDQSLNAELLAAGHAYPAFYATLPADLRTHFAEVSEAARAAQPPVGLWPRSTADPNGAATIADLDALEELVIWPKLFRRIVPYLAAGFPDFDSFDAWLRADPVHRDDELFLHRHAGTGQHARCPPRDRPAAPADGLARGLHHQPRPTSGGWRHRPRTGRRRCPDRGRPTRSSGGRPRPRAGHPAQHHLRLDRPQRLGAGGCRRWPPEPEPARSPAVGWCRSPPRAPSSLATRATPSSWSMVAVARSTR